jgi:hypothetical protein
MFLDARWCWLGRMRTRRCCSRGDTVIVAHPTPMTETKAIIAIIAGCGMIYFGVTMKQFYAAKGLYGAVLSDRKVARWKGRLLFLVVGAVLLFVGIKDLFFDMYK